MKLTHYFSDINNGKNNKLLMNITDCDEKTQENVSKKLAQKSGRALERFKHFEAYFLKRKETENWLRNSYGKLFGVAPKENPFYFVLGESNILFNDFCDDVGVLQIELNTIDTQDITLTLGDSMGVYFNSPNKKLYTMSEFITINQEFINNEFSFLQDYHKYIEVQHWNKSKIEKSNITISYPLLDK
ncbi:MAG: hypothetical protein ACLUH5_02370 [Eubacterium sp.]